MAEQRKKEIGIRKILGASATNVIRLMSKDFVLLVSLGCVLAFPIAYFFIKNWLSNYELKIDIPLTIFALAGIGTIAITLLTVSIKSLHAALMNPVESIKSE